MIDSHHFHVSIIDDIGIIVHIICHTGQIDTTELIVSCGQRSISVPIEIYSASIAWPQQLSVFLKDNSFLYKGVLTVRELTELYPESQELAQRPTCPGDVTQSISLRLFWPHLNYEATHDCQVVQFLRPFKRSFSRLLPSDPTAATNIPPYSGAIEHISTDGIEGWCLNAHDYLAVTIALYIEGHFVSIATPGNDRLDVAAMIGRPAQCGFQLPLPDSAHGLSETLLEVVQTLFKVIPDYRPLIEICVSETQYSLRRLDTFDRQVPPSSYWAQHISKKRRSISQPEVFRQSLQRTVISGVSHQPLVRLIAFYLPQFHPIAENDEWWGRGFTEWANVSVAKPLFSGHYQPHIPADLGFYDLRLPEVQERQAELAREHGIYGFCYYWYWFSGRKILETPIYAMLQSGKPDFPFCLCWANESWSRRWDGSEAENLLYQSHDIEVDKTFIYDVLPFLKDARYITIDGNPLLIVYRVSLLPNPAEVFAAWRLVARANGLPGLHICMAETFGLNGPYQYGCDTSVEFPPHKVVSPLVNETVLGLPSDYTGNIYDYNQVVANDLNALQPDYTRFRTVMLSWDNTARRGKAGNVFYGSSPERYEVWLREAAHQTARRLDGDHRLMFVNAWNEWAEGTHLEPDRKYGRQYLQATRRALFEGSDWKTILASLKAYDFLDSDTLKEFAHTLEQRFSALQSANDFFVKAQIDSRRIYWGRSGLSETRPIILAGKSVESAGHFVLERVNQYPRLHTYIVCRDVYLNIEGWFFFPGLPLEPATPTFMVLKSCRDPDLIYSGSIFERKERRDVVKYMEAKECEALWAGFQFNAELAHIEPGEYTFSIRYPTSSVVYEASASGSVIFV